MTPMPVQERRQYQRYPQASSVEFSHGPSQRDYPGRCIDISAGGLFMYVPATVPVQTGQGIRIKAGSIDRPDFTDISGRPVEATIVRVERSTLLTQGSIAVGVRFN